MASDTDVTPNTRAAQTAPATKKKIAAKKVATKKTATKKVVTKKTAATKKSPAPTTKRTSAAAKPSSAAPAVQQPEISHQERYEMIANMAYFRAEQRGFEPGWEVHDWLESERIIDEQLRNRGQG